MSSLIDQLDVLARGVGCVLAAIPSTLFVPLHLTMAVTRRYRREDQLRRLHFMVSWAAFCRRHFLRIELDVRGREHLPQPSQGHLYISNHQSWADIPVLIESLDTVAFLSKTLIRHIPLVGLSAYAGGSIFVARNDAASRQQALRETLRMAQESTAVVIFPEGTRSPDGKLREKIHPATIRAAHQHGLKVVPVGLDGTYRVLPKTMDRVRPGRVAVSIGPVLDPADFADAGTWTEAVWGKVKELHDEARARARAS